MPKVLTLLAALLHSVGEIGECDVHRRSLGQVGEGPGLARGDGDLHTPLPVGHQTMHISLLGHHGTREESHWGGSVTRGSVTVGYNHRSCVPIAHAAAAVKVLERIRNENGVR